MNELDEDRVLDRIEAARRRRPRFRDERITMAHGAGGKATRQLVEGLLAPKVDNELLAPLDDAALLHVDGVRLAFTTDAFVVRPLRFPGGSIGELAVNGTVNDLAVSGAVPSALSVAIVLEEGLDTDIVEGEMQALAGAALQAGVDVAAGDTKVVERGKADGMYMVTTGVGRVADSADVGAHRVREGDRVLVSGPIGDHGIAILLARGDLDLAADVRSDTQSLWPIAGALLDACGSSLHCMRDATRGGVATVLNEIAIAADAGIVIDEARIPCRDAVTGACELLGIDPLYVANEGKLVAFVAPDCADAALEAMQSEPGGAEAALIGEVRTEPEGRVLGRTTFGGHRLIDMLVGDPLPRIC